MARTRGPAGLLDDVAYWYEAADFRPATIRPLSEVIRKRAERPSQVTRSNCPLAFGPERLSG
jgi:hypothetical protein